MTNLWYNKNYSSGCSGDSGASYCLTGAEQAPGKNPPDNVKVGDRGRQRFPGVKVALNLVSSEARSADHTVSFLCWVARQLCDGTRVDGVHRNDTFHRIKIRPFEWLVSVAQCSFCVNFLLLLYQTATGQQLQTQTEHKALAVGSPESVSLS